MHYDFNGHRFNFLHPANTKQLEEFLSFLIIEYDYRKSFWDPRSGDTVLDIGVDAGSYALPALAMGANVIAIDPRMESLSNLKRNVSMNPGFGRRLEVIQTALDDKNGKICFSAHGMWSTSNSSSCREKINAKKLDDIGLDSPVDWMKIDTEGSELRILHGAEETILTHKPDMIIEAHLWHDKHMDRKIVSYLRSLNPRYGFQTVTDMWGMVANIKRVFVRNF